jgi:hypothetical protein
LKCSGKRDDIRRLLSFGNWIMYLEIDDIIREAIFAELESQTMRTLQNPTPSPKCEMSRYPFTSLQKTNKFRDNPRMCSTHTQFLDRQFWLAGVSWGKVCRMCLGCIEQWLALVFFVTQTQTAGFQSQASGGIIGLLNVGGYNPDTMNVPCTAFFGTM